MKKFEYKRLLLQLHVDCTEDFTLKLQGQGGWELVTVVEELVQLDGYNIAFKRSVAYFKREVS